VDFTGVGEPRVEPRPYYKAMVEAMDTEIGRLLQHIDSQRDRTYVIFLGDNGTPGEVSTPPYAPDRVKQTLFQGGINVPFIVSGPTVTNPGSHCHVPADTTDVYSTVLEFAGVAPMEVLPTGYELDSRSLAPFVANPDLPVQDKHSFSELFTPNGFGPYLIEGRAISDGRFKLIRAAVNGVPVPDRIYDTLVDPYELVDFAEEPFLASPLVIRAYRRLSAALTDLLAPPVFEPTIRPGMPSGF
jgi:arylsulfatase A-like enzyme